MRPKTNTTLSFKVFMLLAALQLALSNSSFSQSEVNTDVTYGFSTNRAMLWVPAGWNSVASHERWGIVNCPGAGTVATEGGIGIVDNEGLHYYLTNNTFDLQGVVITPQRPSTGGSTEVNQPMIGAAIDYLITNYGVTRIYLTGYSLGASDVYDYARLNAHKISGVYFVAGSTAHTPLPGTNDSLALLPMWFHTGTADGMQPMGNYTRVMEAFQSLDPVYPPETTFPWGVSHGSIDNQAYSQFKNVAEPWLKLHHKNIDTTAAFYIDSLERGFEVGFWLKCERLVNRLSASAHKTSLLSRLSTAKTNHFGTGMKMATLNFTNATTVAGYSNMTVNANNQTVSGLLDATGTNTGWTYTRQTATSTQERTQGLGVSYYNVPASIHSTGHEFFNTGTATDIIGGLDNSKTYTIFYFGSKTASVSVDPTIVTSIGAESDTVNQQYFNTREYALFNSKSPSSGNITVTHRNLLANAITIQNFVIIIEHGSTNATPTANAGSDVSITLPTTSTTLDASSSSDSDGSITGYLWTFITGGTGTSTPSISNSTSASTGITGLTAAGTYFFRVTVTDNNGATDDDDVIVTVNPATQAIQVNVYGGTNPYNNTAWNNWNIGSGTVSNVTSSAFNYADGSASGVTATLSFSQAVADNGSSYGGTMCPPEVLRYTSYSSTNRTLTIGNLDGSATYDIEFYASRSSTGNATVFTIGGVSDTVVTGNNTTVPAVFSSVAPDGSNNIVVSLARTSGSSFHYLNGFKLTKIASGARSKRNQAAEPAGNTTGDVKLLLSPNPVAGRLKISFSSDRTGIVKLDIYDAMGRMVESRSFVKVHQQLQGNLDVAGLGKGLYYVSIEDGSGKRIVTKFLKQ